MRFSLFMWLISFHFLLYGFSFCFSFVSFFSFVRVGNGETSLLGGCPFVEALFVEALFFSFWFPASCLYFNTLAKRKSTYFRGDLTYLF